MNTKISRFTLDDASLKSRTPELEHERHVALSDLLYENHFLPKDMAEGPYSVKLRLEDQQRLVFEITPEGSEQVKKVSLSVQPLKSIIRDYFLVCESYYQAIKSHEPRKIEAVDMGRRGLHNEGSELLKTLLEEKIEVDFCTARRLFTLISILHMK